MKPIKVNESRSSWDYGVTIDPNVSEVCDKYAKRALKGFEKYGTDTTRGDLTTEEWLVHLQEELMDATVYIERLLKEVKKL